ncbi:MAG: DUF2079 domain-containing protein [Acidimicrobiales bacterium]
MSSARRVGQWCRQLWGRVARVEHLPVIVLIGAYVAWFSYQCFRLTFGYGYPPFDMGVFDQGMWLLTHFHVPFVTVMGRNLFGDHTSFILLLVAPFYRLFPEPEGLVLLQTLVLAAGSVPIYVLARKYLKSTSLATAMVAIYLLNPILERGNLDQFHPEAFQVLLISLAIYAALESKPVLLGVSVALALMVKEDAALLVVALGVWVAVYRNRKWGAWIIGSALAWTVVAIKVIIPSILGAPSIYGGRIPFGGVSGLIGTLVRRPGELFAYLRSDNRPFYLWQVGATVGFVFVLAPEVAAIGALVVLEILVSNDVYMQQIIYQYSLPLAPVLVMGTLYAVSRQRSARRRNVATGLALVAALWTCIVWGYAPFSDLGPVAPYPPGSPTYVGLAYDQAALPATASVASYFPWVSHLDHRVQVYVWPTPFSAQDWGEGHNNGARLAVASQVQYLLLPVPLTSADHTDVFARIAPYFTLVRSLNGVGLYKRTR